MKNRMMCCLKTMSTFAKDCALVVKVTFIDNQLDSEYKMNLKETIRRAYEKVYSRNI